LFSGEDTSSGPVKERKSQFSLEVRDAFGQTGLRDANPAGGFGK
jgi:hypothetical protein